MKYRIEKTGPGEGDEIIIRCDEITDEIRRVINLLEGDGGRLTGIRQDGSARVVIDKKKVLYFESVDGKTFAYYPGEVFKVDFTLSQLIEYLDDINFFRCSKSMIINIDKVRELKSLSSNRIDALLINGEHILISRTYASDFRKRLRGE